MGTNSETMNLVKVHFDLFLFVAVFNVMTLIPNRMTYVSLFVTV